MPAAIEALTGALLSPALKAVAAHWRDACGTRWAPAWKDIRPAAIAPHLPIVWAMAYDAASDRFVGRLAGDRVVQILGRNIHGLMLSDIYHSEQDRFLARARRVIDEPALFRNYGAVYAPFGRYGLGEGLALPLSSDGRSGDGLFGASIYRGWSDVGGVWEYADSEIEEWYPIADAGPA